MIPYPQWICSECGNRYGRWPDGHLGTFHHPNPDDEIDRCGWCGSRERNLTEPRDFNYPPHPEEVSE